MNTASAYPIAQILLTRGLRPSPQRVAVFGCLMSNKGHLTVEMIYKKLIPDYPTLSRTTVYQTLEALHDCGLVLKIVADGEMCFEAKTSDHGHFICTQCKGISNIDYPAETAFPQPSDDYHVKETHLYYRGLCPKCRTKTMKSAK